MPLPPIGDKLAEVYSRTKKALEAIEDPTPEQESKILTECFVDMLDIWAISRGLIKTEPAPSGREFETARKMLGKILEKPDIGIWRSRDDAGWTAGVVVARGISSDTHRIATVTDAEVRAEIQAEDEANGR